MVAIQQLVHSFRRYQRSKHNRALLIAMTEAESRKILSLSPELTDTEIYSRLKSSDSVSTLILNAFNCHSEQVEKPLRAYFQLLEKMRFAEVEASHLLCARHNAFTHRLESLNNNVYLTSAKGKQYTKSEAQAQYSHWKSLARIIRRRKRLLLSLSFLLLFVSLLILAGDLALLYNNFQAMINARGQEDIASLLTEIVSTVMTGACLLILTHIGSAPLYLKLLEIVYPVNSDHSPEDNVSPRKTRLAYVVMSLATSSVVATSCSIAFLREYLVKSEGSSVTFILLSTLGLPALNLLAHTTLQHAGKHWKSYTTQQESFLEAIKHIDAMDYLLAQCEAKKRKSGAIAHELEKTDKAYQARLNHAYEKIVNHPSVQSEIRRLAELLDSLTQNLLLPIHNASMSFEAPTRTPEGGRDAENVITNTPPQVTSGRGAKIGKNSLPLILLLTTSLFLGCGQKHRTHHVTTLLDNTAEYLESPGAKSGWMEGVRRIKQVIPNMDVDGKVDLYTMAGANNTPRPQLCWNKDTIQGKVILSARDRKRHVDEFVENLDSLYSKSLDHPVTAETKIVETIYEILRLMANQQDASSFNRFIIVSDLEPYTASLTASRIVQSDEALDSYCHQVESLYPPVEGATPQVTVVYTPSIDMLKASPSCMRRLKTFWLRFFDKIGCQFVDWVSPEAQAESIDK